MTLGVSSSSHLFPRQRSLELKSLSGNTLTRNLFESFFLLNYLNNDFFCWKSEQLQNSCKNVLIRLFEFCFQFQWNKNLLGLNSSSTNIEIERERERERERDVNKRWKVCSKSEIKTQKRRHWCCSDVFFVTSEHISYLLSVYLFVGTNYRGNEKKQGDILIIFGMF